MAMYAMGVESSVEVLGYLNRALDICAINGAVNGYIYSSPLFVYVLFFFYLFIFSLIIA